MRGIILSMIDKGIEADKPSNEGHVEKFPFRNVLIVEDQRFTLEGLTFVLGKCGLKYEVVKSYEDAKARIPRGGFDLVLLDNTMPLSDAGDLEETDFSAYAKLLQAVGYGLTALIRSSEPTAKIIGTTSGRGVGDFDAVFEGKSLLFSDEGEERFRKVLRAISK